MAVLKTIPVDLLRPGMYVARFDLSWFRHPFLSSRLGMLKDAELPAYLRSLGVTRVEIDLDRGLDVDLGPVPDSSANPQPAEEPEPPQPPFEFSPADVPPPTDSARTLRFAKRFFSQSMDCTRRVMAGAHSGKPVALDEAKLIIGRLIATVESNRSVVRLLAVLKAYDEYTYTHCLNVAAMGVLFGKHLGLAGKQLETLGLAGLLHDVGKCLLPSEIVNKPGKLTEEEFTVMKQHTVLGFDYIKDQPGVPAPVALGVLEHHERQDGSGYPREIAGREIAGVSRILSVLDVYDALTSHRVYRPPMSPHLALRTLFAQRGTAFPEALLNRFITCVGVYPPGSVVQLRNGCFAVVTSYDERTPLHPSMTIFKGPDGRPVRPRRVETLRLRQEPSGSGYEIARHVEPSEVAPPAASFWR
ncbi:MAG: HD-GYP domain-containing protein [Acidobacteriota bacterium]